MGCCRWGRVGEEQARREAGGHSGDPESSLQAQTRTSARLPAAAFPLREHPISAPQNSILRGVYPGSPSSWLAVVMATVGSSYCNVDISMGLVCYIQRRLPEG